MTQIIMWNNVDDKKVLTTNSNVLHNHFDGANKIIFKSVFSEIFRYFSRSFRARILLRYISSQQE